MRHEQGTIKYFCTGSTMQQLQPRRTQVLHTAQRRTTGQRPPKKTKGGSMTLNQLEKMADTYGSVQKESSQGRHRFTIGGEQQ